MTDEQDRKDQEWREKLTPEQYAVTRSGATEPPFSGVYNNAKDAGMYCCICCGAELFSSGEKFDSGSGWPSFWEAVDPARVKLIEDSTHGMRRTEVKCASCDAHLGHVFDDGPQPTGQRFCINSCSLDLEKKEG